jgi:hypothetical protein
LNGLMIAITIFMVLPQLVRVAHRAKRPDQTSRVPTSRAARRGAEPDYGATKAALIRKQANALKISFWPRA